METTILRVVQDLLAQWQFALGEEVEVVLGGSLVSGLFIFEGAEVVDVDVRFLVDDPADTEVRRRIEAVTGLTYRKSITVADWPSGMSSAAMVEAVLAHPALPLPLEIEGCIRSRAYIGWARFYQTVLSPAELAEFRREKVRLRADLKAYKALKSAMIGEVIERCLARGLVTR